MIPRAAVDRVPRRDGRGEGPARGPVLRGEPARAAGIDARGHQHRRDQPLGPHPRPHERGAGQQRRWTRSSADVARPYGRTSRARLRAREGHRSIARTTSSSPRRASPASTPRAASLYLGRPATYGAEKRDEYTKFDYHKPSDEVKSDWDLSGAVEDARLLLLVGDRLARGSEYPSGMEARHGVQGAPGRGPQEEGRQVSDAPDPRPARGAWPLLAAGLALAAIAGGLANPGPIAPTAGRPSALRAVAMLFYEQSPPWPTCASPHATGPVPDARGYPRRDRSRRAWSHRPGFPRHGREGGRRSSRSATRSAPRSGSRAGNLPLVPGDSCHYVEIASSILNGEGPVKHYVESFFKFYPDYRPGKGSRHPGRLGHAPVPLFAGRGLPACGRGPGRLA